MSNSSFDLEAFWADLLSQDEARVRSVFNSLTSAEQERILEHLTRMATENGWHPNQRIAAQTAIQILKPGK